MQIWEMKNNIPSYEEQFHNFTEINNDRRWKMKFFVIMNTLWNGDDVMACCGRQNELLLRVGHEEEKILEHCQKIEIVNFITTGANNLAIEILNQQLEQWVKS